MPKKTLIETIIDSNKKIPGVGNYNIQNSLKIQYKPMRKYH